MAEPTPPQVRPGVRVGIDVGDVRIGVARSDPGGALATPVRTITRSRRHNGVSEIAQIVADSDAAEVIIGLPRQLSGDEGHAARGVREYAGLVARMIEPIPVRLVDERLTSVTAHSALHQAGRPGRQHRQVVDQVAATVILQAALDAERASGRPPGEHVLADTDAAKKGTA